MENRITPRRRIRAVGEVLLVRLAMFLVPFLPRAVVLAAARFGGTVAFRFARRDRRVTLANIDLAFGNAMSHEGKIALARAAFQSYALTMLDLFWFAKFHQRRLERYLEFDAAVKPHLDEATICVTAHYGNWEVMGQGAYREGYRLVSVAKPIANPYLDRLLNRERERNGQVVVQREGALRQLVKYIRRGGQYRVALLLDQETMPREGGVFVDFFGVPTPISRAAAELALRLKAPLMMIFCHWDDDRGKYRIHGSPVLRGIEGMEPEALTQRIAAMVEEQIRAQPQHWLWMYKRWKHKLPGFPVERYPFYADY